MAVNLKTATPDTTLPAAGFLFGADSQSASSPSVYPLSALAQTLLGSTVFSGDTVTASKPLLDMAQTWNNAAVAFTADRINVTNTASNAASLLFDRQVGGASMAAFRVDGALVLNSNVVLTHDAANVLSLRNGTNAQAFNVYNTYTDASNYERGVFDWSSSANVLTIGTTKAGTGATRNLRFIVGGAVQLEYGSYLPGGWYSPATIMSGGDIIATTYFGAPASSVTLSMNSGACSLTLDTASAVCTQPFSAPTLQSSTAYTVATLPSAASAGAGTRAYVTDATVTTFLSTVSGGAVNKVPVISDGTNWLIG